MNTSHTYDAESLDLEIDEFVFLWHELIKILSNRKERFSHLNNGEGKALLTLFADPEGLSAGELSAKLGVTTGRMANILHQLEDKHFIERTIQPENRRKSLITLTDEGTTHVQDLLSEAHQKSSQLINRLGKEDAQELIRIMRKLVDSENDQS
ncbi:MAG: MarR family winged helix-turn-helix transcriptional regulator [Raoultibacter sp.]|jgi:DNA-binding MarR family transcriptional regulator